LGPVPDNSRPPNGCTPSLDRIVDAGVNAERQPVAGAFDRSQHAIEPVGRNAAVTTPAVPVERATRVDGVVDTWPRGYSQPADVITIQKWVTGD
jgi:hypothetical protein